MKHALLALFVISGIAQADRAAIDDAHYPKGMYYCADSAAGHYLLEIGNDDNAVMIDDEDIGELQLAYSSARDKLDDFDAKMMVSGRYVGKVIATPSRATIYFPDHSVVQCDNKRPVNREVIAE